MGADGTPVELSANDPLVVDLASKLHSMKGVRFTSAERIKAKERWSTYAIAALSIYVLVPSLVSLFGDVAWVKDHHHCLSGSSIIMSVVILVIGILEGSREYSKRAHLFHACGLELSRLHKELRLVMTSGKVPSERLQEILQSYHHVLERCENHDPIDYRYATEVTAPTDAQETGSIDRWLKLWCARMAWYRKVYLPYHLAVFFPLLVLVIILLKHLLCQRTWHCSQ